MLRRQFIVRFCIKIPVTTNAWLFLVCAMLVATCAARKRKVRIFVWFKIITRHLVSFEPHFQLLSKYQSNTIQLDRLDSRLVISGIMHRRVRRRDTVHRHVAVALDTASGNRVIERRHALPVTCFCLYSITMRCIWAKCLGTHRYVCHINPSIA